jgi:hypothetical protein
MIDWTCQNDTSISNTLVDQVHTGGTQAPLTAGRFLGEGLVKACGMGAQVEGWHDIIHRKWTRVVAHDGKPETWLEGAIN